MSTEEANAPMSSEASGTQSALGPVARGERIDSIDVLRGVAVLGILTINIFLFGLPSELGKSPVLFIGEGVANLTTYFIAFIAFEGSQRAIFSMLFGAGIVIFTSRMLNSDRAQYSKRIYYRRTWWLIVFGLVDAYLLLWMGDILFLYGVVGLVLYFARDWTPRRLLLVSGAILLVLCLVRLALSAGFSVMESLAEDPDRAATFGMDDETLASIRPPTPEQLSDSIATRGGGYLSAFGENAFYSLKSQTVNTILMLFWDALALMMIGMALFKMKVLSAFHSAKVYLLMTVVGLGVGYFVNWWEVHDTAQLEFYVPYFEWTYDIGRISNAMGYVGLVMLICKLQILPIVRSSLAAVGRMALSNYVMQTIICNTMFVVFGLFGTFDLAQLYLVVLGVWTAQLIYSPLWLNHFNYGPLEWLWRKLTYAGLAQRTITMRQ